MIRMNARYVDANGCLTHEGFMALADLDRIREAVAKVEPPAGGAVIDVEARAVIAALKAAFG